MNTNTFAINIRPGDIISLPQPAESYSDNPFDSCSPGEQLSVLDVWWNNKTHRLIHAIKRADGRNIIIAFDQPNTLIIRHQTNFGTEATYQIGQKVYAHWMHQTSPGIIEDATHIPGPDGESVYVVLTARGTRAYVGPDDLKADTSPHPAIGQIWVCLHGDASGMSLTVVEVAENGLDVMCQRGQSSSTSSYLLSSVHHGILVDTAPTPVGEKGVDYDDVLMEVKYLGRRLVRVFRY